MGLFTQKTSDIKEVVAGGSSQKYIYGGVYHHIIIKGFTAGKSSQKGTPQIEMEVYTKEGGPEASSKQVFYFTPNTMDNVQAQLLHIANKIVTNKEFNDEVDDSSIESLATSLNNLLKGQSLRMKFRAEEYINGSGEVKEAARLPYAGFAEAIQEGAEHAPVADEDTKLVYDKKDKYDFKALSPADRPTAEADVAEEVIGGLDDL